MPRKRFLLLAAVTLLVGSIVRLALLSSTPPGLHFDEAANATIVRLIAFEGYRPIFIPDFTGKEVLWFYSAAALMRFAGASVFVVRLASVYLGIVTIAAAGWAVRQMFAEDDRRDWLALLTMAVLATGFWLAVLNRIPFRANAQPLLQALTVGTLFKAWHTDDTPLPYVILAGLWTGLSAYTYLAVRVFPLLLIVMWAVVVISKGWRALGHMLIYGVTAGVIVLPLGLYFIQNPDRFLTRVTQVAADTPTAAVEGWLRALGMLFIKGDPLLRFNLPDKPLFGPVLGMGLVVGFMIALRELLQESSTLSRVRGVLLLLWPFVFLAPTALATEAITPSNLRAVGLAPFIALYPALALTRFRYGAWGAVTVGIGVLTVINLHQWAANPALHYDYDAHIVAMGNYLDQHAPDAPTYVGTQHFQHPTLLYTSQRGAQAQDLFGAETIVLPPEGQAVLAVSRDAGFPPEWHTALSDYRLAEPLGPDGLPQFSVYQVGDDLPLLPPIARPPANFANIVLFEGAVTTPAVSGETAAVDALWHVIGQPDRTDYVFVAEVCDQWGWCWVKTDQTGGITRGRNDSYLSSEWQVGERLLTRINIPLPKGIPPGEYRVEFRVFSTGTQTALPRIDQNGAFAGFIADTSGLSIGPDTVTDLSDIPVQHRVEQSMAQGVDLFGYDLPITGFLAGEVLHLALYWQPQQADLPSRDITLTLGDVVLTQRAPVHDMYPAAMWQPDELIIDRYAIRLPKQIDAGRYPLTVRYGQGEPILLGQIDVESITRRESLPADIPRLEDPLPFGEAVELIAAQAARPEEGSLHVQLVWEALTEVQQGYTVFVHLIDSGGTVIAQRDRPPTVDGRPYPFDLWLPGEIVVDDPYIIDLPSDLSAGAYRIRVGTYDPQTGDTLGDPVILPFTLER